MSLAALTNIEKTFGKRLIFDKLCLNVEKGERIGFIGPNGAGKTTLFKVLTGELVPDSGIVAISKTTKVGLLSQDPKFEAGNTVMDEAELAFSELHRLSHEMREIEHEMGELEGDALDKILEKYQSVQHDFELAGGYAWRHRLEATLLGIGLPENTWEQMVTTLSGGQRSRLALAKLLIAEPDMLLLDEPTNHLDLVAIEWLEKYLLEFNGATVLISHDRYLLDRLATRIVWLTRAQLNSYPGNYSAFVAQREVQELSQARAYEEQQADIEKQKEFIRRFGAGQRSKEAKGREKRLNRLLASDDVVRSLEVNKHIHLSINTDQRAGDQVLTVRELSKSYDSIQLWQDLGFFVKRGERIGIIGPNGSGKTTLLETILGHRDADAGDIKWGANLKIGYYDQKLDEFDPEATVSEEVRGNREVKDQDLRNVLALMLFRGDDPDKQIKLLSGGERARVALCQLLIDKPNVLILDEPTNHLDIASAEALEGALKAFEGTILFVSHDRYFLDKVSQRLLVLDPPGVIDFEGNYTGWMKKLAANAKAEAERKAAAEAAKRQPKHSPKPTTKQQAKKSNADNPYLRPFGKLSRKELEQQITDTEIALAECQTQFGSGGKFKEANRGQKIQSEYDTLAKKLKQLEAEYFERAEE